MLLVVGEQVKLAYIFLYAALCRFHPLPLGWGKESYARWLDMPQTSSSSSS